MINVTITKEDAFELKMLRDQLQNAVTQEQSDAKRRASRGSGHYRTSDEEREAQKGLDVVSKILAQVP